MQATAIERGRDQVFWGQIIVKLIERLFYITVKVEHVKVYGFKDDSTKVEINESCVYHQVNYSNDFQRLGDRRKFEHSKQILQ